MSLTPLTGSGLGLRRALMGPLQDQGIPAEIDFFEVAPENWIGVGGRLGKGFRRLVAERPLVCHGLSLSIGSPGALDEVFLLRLKRFLDDFGVDCYSEHLSYTSDDGHLYDLMPIPFTAEAVDWVATRIRRVQEILERRIAIENISYYAAPGQRLSETEFVLAVLERADCDLLLDVNNLYVNSINHGGDAEELLTAVEPGRVRYLHLAGHYVEAPDLLIDTHGAAVVDPVWRLLALAYHRFGPVPTLLERDFNIPPLPALVDELRTVRQMQQGVASDAPGCADVA